MKILITGGTGFIGSYVLNLIPDTFQVLAISRKNKKKTKKIKWIKSSLKNLNKFEKKIVEFNPDYLVHLAWEGIPIFSKINCEKNFVMSKSLIELLVNKTNIKKILVSGTCFEYRNNNGMCLENIKINPQNEFIKSKIRLFKYINKVKKNRKIKLYWLRMFYVYGPGQRNESLIPFCINKIKRGIYPKIKHPLNQNDFIYVEDVARAIIFFLKKKVKSGIYNIGSGKPIILKSLINLIWVKIQKKKLKMIDQNLSSNSNFWSNINKVKKNLNWRPKISIDKGLDKTINSKLLNK